MALTQVSTGGIKDGQVHTADLADAQITAGKLHADALDHTYTLGASGTDHYTFTGEGLTGAVNDPTLYLTRGKTYRFVNGNSSGAHPFRIQSVAGAGGTEYNTGVTNNAGAGGSTIIFEVPHDAPDVLYYICTSHATMNGIFYVTGALADGTVTTAKLADDAVTNAKLGAGAVGTTEIATNAVTSDKINTGQVTTAKLGDLAVSTAKLGNDAVTTAKIADEAVTLAKLPHGDGSSDGKFLRSNNGADPTFETVTSTAINNNADNRIITGSGTANTLEAETNLTWNGTNLTVAGTGSNIVLPSGTTAQRTGSPANYSLRYNTTLSELEFYDGTNWNTINQTKSWDLENTATHWWKSEGIQSKTLWNAQVGGANLTPGHTDDLTYNATDSGFNNQKTIDFNPNTGSDFGTLGTAEVDDSYWNGTEAWSVIMVIEKTQHGSGNNLGDGLFVQVYNSTQTNSWSVDIAGDHTWGQTPGEQVSGISGYADFNYATGTKKGIFCFRCDANGASSAYMFQPSGSSSFTTLATANSLPSSLPTSGFDRLNIGNFHGTTGSSHEWGGTIAEIAYYKGIRVTDAELTRFSTYAKTKFNI